jgi:hypothetical protein
MTDATSNQICLKCFRVDIMFTTLCNLLNTLCILVKVVNILYKQFFGYYSFFDLLNANLISNGEV